LSTTFGFVDSIIALSKFSGKSTLNWEDKRNLILSSITLIDKGITFINLFSKIFKEDLTKGITAPLSLIFAIINGQNSIRKSFEGKNYPAIVLQSYSLASGTKMSVEAVFKAMHRLHVASQYKHLGYRAAAETFKKGYLLSESFAIASKFTGPIGYAILAHDVIRLCESKSRSIRMGNNVAWSNLCVFMESIDSLLKKTGDLTYHDLTVSLPKIKTNELKGYMSESIYENIKPLSWEKFLGNITKKHNTDTTWDIEKTLRKYDLENDPVLLFKMGGMSIETIAELTGIDDDDVKKSVGKYEMEKLVELEEHWRIHKNTKEKLPEEVHQKAIIDYSNNQ
jgi:hypothetical protein